MILGQCTKVFVFTSNKSPVKDDSADDDDRIVDFSDCINSAM